MQKKIDLKKRIVELWDVNTGLIESEIVGYLDRKMKVCFYSAYFNNLRYVFIRGVEDQSNNSITVSGYRKKQPGENISVSFK